MSSHKSSSASERPSGSRSCVIGVDVGGTNLRIALANTNGTVLARSRHSSQRISSPEALVAHIRSGMNDLLTKACISRKSVRSVAVGVPGVTDPGSGTVLLTSFFGGWKNVQLRDALVSALDLPAAIENDVKLAAIGERWQGAACGLSDFVFFAIGTGIAAGIFANGQLLRGANHAAGEVGYMFVPGASETIAEHGAPGSLECAIGGEGLRLEWQRIQRHNGQSLGNDLSATRVFALARSDNAEAAAFLQRAAQMLAYAVYNISVVLNPALFVLGGGVGMDPVFLQATQSVLQRYSDPVRPKLVPSALGEDAQLLGSIRLALDTHKR